MATSAPTAASAAGSRLKPETKANRARASRASSGASRASGGHSSASRGPSLPAKRAMAGGAAPAARKAAAAATIERWPRRPQPRPGQRRGRVHGGAERRRQQHRRPAGRQRLARRTPQPVQRLGRRGKREAGSPEGAVDAQGVGPPHLGGDGAERRRARAHRAGVDQPPAARLDQQRGRARQVPRREQLDPGVAQGERAAERRRQRVLAQARPRPPPAAPGSPR